jgi:subtilase family serine protease
MDRYVVGKGWLHGRIVLCAAACLVVVGVAAAPASATSLRARLVQTLAPSLKHVHQLLGPAPTDATVSALVSLQPRDAAGLRTLIAHVTNSADKRYGHYLSPAQFRRRFAPTKDDANAVAAWLRSSGLKVTAIPANHRFVAVSGTVSQAQHAFDLTIGRVRDTLGAIVNAPLRRARVPAALSRIVSGVRGLDGGDVVKAQSLLAPPAYQTSGPCSSFFGEITASDTPGAFGQGPFPVAPCGYTPTQLQSAYGLNPAYAAGVDGRGVKVAIIDPFDSPRAKQDTDTYSARHGLPPVSLTRVADPYATAVPSLPSLPDALSKVPLVGSVGGLVTGLVDPDGASEEETLDLEAVHALAPGAAIVYEASDSLLDISLLIAQNDVVDHKRAQIVSNSYGSAVDSQDPMEDAVLQQAAAEGIGFYFSSGDQGDETRDPNGPGDRETDASANNPLATAVGGTSIAIGADGKAMWQTYWGNFTSTLVNGAWAPTPPGDFYAGGGGGTSQAYAEPDYQKGVVPDDLANHWSGKPAELGATQTSIVPLQSSPITPQVPGRVEPDISMLGDPNTGMIVGDTQDFTAYKNLLGQQLPTDDVHYAEFRIGGTSLSSPLFAGLMALADQAAGHPHGFVNPALYAAYKHDPSIVTDLTATTAKNAVVRRNYVNSTDTSGGITTLLRDFDEPLTLHDRPGFDDATGMGTPNGMPFLQALAPGSTMLRSAAKPAPKKPAHAKSSRATTR